MIKFDKDALSTLQALEKAGFETYAFGDCVRDVLRGEGVYDWDLATRATREEILNVFPDGTAMKENGRAFVRLDLTRIVEDKNGEEEIQGIVADIHPFADQVETLLAARGFTICAMADNPNRTFVDPYDGQQDLRRKLIRTIGDPVQLFREKPIFMIQAVRLAAETGFDLHRSVYDAIKGGARVLLEDDPAGVLTELELLLVSPHTGKGLSLLGECGLMPAVFGADVAGRMSSSDMRSFHTLCENVDKTQRVLTRRLGLLFTVLPEKKGLAAIERLPFDAITRQHLEDAMKEIINIQFLNDEVQFKRYLCEHGRERYEYLHNLSKAQRIVYDQPTLKIESRNHMMKTILSRHDPVYIEDLAVDQNDLLEAGLADSPEKAEELLYLVASAVHRDPKANQRGTLLAAAKKFSRSKFAAKTRYVRWVR